jgi:hypothetical protein
VSDARPFQPPPVAPAPPPFGVPPAPVGSPPPFGQPPPPLGQPPRPPLEGPPAPPSEEIAREPGGFGMTTVVIAILLATLGVMGAFITWRMGQLGNVAEDASRAALAARRERSASLVEAGTQVMQATGDWLGYELAKRKADSLRAAGQAAEALRWDREASSYWFGVPNADIALDGTYDPQAYLDALVAANTEGKDVEPDAHLDAAALAQWHASRLGQLGVMLAAILPLLTLAEITHRRRLQLVLAGGSAVGVVAGIVALVLLW